MKCKGRVLKWGTLLLALTLALVSTPLESVRAAETGEGDNVMTLVVETNATAVSDMDFRIYHVADVTEPGLYEPVEEIEDAPISWIMASSGDWQAAALTLESYLVQQNAAGQTIEPVAQGTTNANGRLTFSQLDDGVYLVVSDVLEGENATYQAMPAMVILPDESTEKTLTDDAGVIVEPKVEVTPRTTEPISLTVTKVWEDEANPDHRPDSVTVNLYGNGEEVSQMTLSEENNWTYTWEDLDASVNWEIMEVDVPEGYTVTVVPNGQNYVVTNTWEKSKDDPDPEETPTPDPGDTPSTSTKLPQTGQLWWPVPLFGAVGLCLFLWGWALRQNQKKKK